MSDVLNARMFEAGKHIHIVGIGGTGMSAIARVLLETGVRVSGSDRQGNATTAALERDGAIIHIGHAADNVSDDTDTVLITSAAHDDNPEIVAAREKGIPVFKRRDALSYLLPDKTMIAVSGTHGKTTTTALIVHLLNELGTDPSYIVGGTMLNTGMNAHAGHGEIFVIEADEYDYMFLGLRPQISIITNIEHDHPDMFPTLDDVIDAFRQFVRLLPPDGTLIANINDPLVRDLAIERSVENLPTLTYGVDHLGADWLANVDDSADPSLTYFGIRYFEGGRQQFEQAESPLAGEHNVSNTMAALAALYVVGVRPNQALPHLLTFRGTGRRLETMGVVNGITVINDYAHHPTAIDATLHALRSRYPKTATWAVWQPHTYSRTRTLREQFARAFSAVDHVLVTDIYAARETPQAGDIESPELARLIALTGHTDARYGGSLEQTADLLLNELNAGDVVIILSAGDAPKIGEMLLKRL
jgi:UDP-N-acetylmuramate--alanine ligase